MANTSRRGFASMDPSKQREIASKGGRAAHAKGTAHEFTTDEARVAGRKGGEAVSRDRAHMSAIGREGGHSRGRARQTQSPGNGGMSSSTDTERSYIGTSQANDRGSASGNRAVQPLTARTERSSKQKRRRMPAAFRFWARSARAQRGKLGPYKTALRNSGSVPRQNRRKSGSSAKVMTWPRPTGSLTR